jgi:PAS domain S-box-containing protein
MTKMMDERSLVVWPEAIAGTLAESIPICVWVAGRDGDIYQGNRAWREYAGPGAELDFRPAASDGEGERIWREAVRAARPVDWEQRLRRKDGALRWHLCHMAPRCDDGGELIGWIVTATDIEAQKQNEAAQKSRLAGETELRKLAETASQAKDELLAIVSHELRTPLGAILGWTRMLRTGAVGHDRLGRALETIERSATVQAKLLEDIFDMCRIVSGKLRIDVRRMDLRQVIEDAVDLVQPAAQTKGVALETSLEEGLRDFAGDPDRLQQVVWNLLANAIKFTPRAGCVTLLMRREGSEVLIEVRDTGAGIPREFLPHVFETFRQVDKSSAGRERGLGLGLSIAREIVGLHGGIVSAFSDGEGKGSQFRVRLPLHAAASQPSEESAVARVVESTAARRRAAAPPARASLSR